MFVIGAFLVLALGIFSLNLQRSVDCRAISADSQSFTMSMEAYKFSAWNCLLSEMLRFEKRLKSWSEQLGKKGKLKAFRHLVCGGTELLWLIRCQIWQMYFERELQMKTTWTNNVTTLAAQWVKLLTQYHKTTVVRRPAKCGAAKHASHSTYIRCWELIISVRKSVSGVICVWTDTLRWKLQFRTAKKQQLTSTEVSQSCARPAGGTRTNLFWVTKFLRSWEILLHENFDALILLNERDTEWRLCSFFNSCMR